MAKLSTFFVLFLLLGLMLCFTTARPEPHQVKTQDLGIGPVNTEASDENCEGTEKEECLTRRTLEAHLDYIYTQEQHH